MYWLIPLCLCLAAVFLWQENKKNYVPAVILKGLASLCFVILGYALGNASKAANLINMGLLLGCIADVLLNLRFVLPRNGQAIFLIGILVFLMGHILYLAAVLSSIRNWIPCVIAAAALTAALMVWIFKRIIAKKAFKIFGVVYIGAVVLLNCAAVTQLIESPSSFAMTFFIGAALFLISDVVLILNTFGRQSRFGLRITNIGLYYLGQILIALSLFFMK